MLHVLILIALQCSLFFVNKNVSDCAAILIYFIYENYTYWYSCQISDYDQYMVQYKWSMLRLKRYSKIQKQMSWSWSWSCKICLGLGLGLEGQVLSLGLGLALSCLGLGLVLQFSVS